MYRNSELWRLSRVMQDEVFYQSRLAMAPGSQKARLLESYEKNITSGRRLSLLVYLFLGLFPIFAAYFPLRTLIDLSSVAITSENMSELIFTSVMAFVMYNALIFLCLAAVGFMNLVILMKGDLFKFLQPYLSGNNLQKLSLYTFLRMNLLPIVIILFAIPLGGLIFSVSPLIIFIVFANNVIVLLFSAFALVNAAHYTSRKVFSHNGNPVLRTLITSMSFLSISFAPALCIFAQEFFISIFWKAGAYNIMSSISNEVLALIFPFSIAYLISNLTLPGLIPTSVFFPAIIGNIIFLGFTGLVIRRGNYCLRTLGYDPSEDNYSSYVSAEDIVVKVTASNPTITLMKQNLRMIFRDYGSLGSFILAMFIPLVLGLQIIPILLLLSVTIDRGRPILLNEFFPIMLFTLGLMPFFINEGFNFSEKKLSGLLDIVPVRSRNVFRSKQVVTSIFAIVGLSILVGFLSFLLGFSLQSLILIIELSFFTVAAVTSFLIAFSYLFGKINKRYTLYKVNLENSILKYVVSVLVPIMVIIADLIIINIISNTLNVVFPWSLGIEIMVNLVFIITLEVIARRIFN